MASTPKNLDEVLKQMERLPEIPSVAIQVSRLLDNPNTDAKELAEMIQMDPSLVAQVLKLCNSAQYGLNREIATINEAVAVLGHKVLRQVVYAILSHGLLNRPINGYALESGALWENSLTCGVYAKYLAQKIQYKHIDLAFTAALLRDIGKIAMDVLILDMGLFSVERTVYTEKCSFLEAEAKVIGVNHCVLGAQLARRWNLPETLASVIEFHHDPSSMPATIQPGIRKLVALVHLADSYTMMTGTGVGIDGLMYPLDNTIFDILEIQKDNNLLDSWYAELLDLKEEVHQMASTFASSSSKAQ